MQILFRNLKEVKPVVKMNRSGRGLDEGGTIVRGPDRGLQPDIMEVAVLVMLPLTQKDARSPATEDIVMAAIGNDDITIGGGVTMNGDIDPLPIDPEKSHRVVTKPKQQHRRTLYYCV